MNLFVTYSGALGGAERLLVDSPPQRPESAAWRARRAPLADAAAAAGIRVFTLHRGRLELRGRRREPALAAARPRSPTRGSCGGWLATCDPDLVVACGGCARRWRRCARRAHLAVTVSRAQRPAPRPAVGRAVSCAAAPAQTLVVVLSRAIAPELDGPAGRAGCVWSSSTPGSTSSAWSARRRRRPRAAGGRGARARSSAGRPRAGAGGLALARRTLPELRLRFVGRADSAATRRCATACDRPRRTSPTWPGASSSPGFEPDPPRDAGARDLPAALRDRVSRSGSPCWRRWPRGGRRSSPPPAGRPRSSTPRAACSIRPATRRRRPRALVDVCSAIPSAPRRMGRRRTRAGRAQL